MPMSNSFKLVMSQLIRFLSTPWRKSSSTFQGQADDLNLQKRNHSISEGQPALILSRDITDELPYELMYPILFDTEYLPMRFILLNSPTNSRLFNCSSSIFVSLFSRIIQHPTNLSAYHSFPPFTSSDSFSSPGNAVTCAADIFTSPIIPPKDCAGLLCGSDFSRNRSLLWTISSTGHHPDTQLTILVIPHDGYQAYPLRCVHPLLPWPPVERGWGLPSTHLQTTTVLELSLNFSILMQIPYCNLIKPNNYGDVFHKSNV